MQDFRDMELSLEDKMHSTIKDAFNMIEMQYQRELQEKIPGGEYKSVF